MSGLLRCVSFFCNRDTAVHISSACWQRPVVHIHCFVLRKGIMDLVVRNDALVCVTVLCSLQILRRILRKFGYSDYFWNEFRIFNTGGA